MKRSSSNGGWRRRDGYTLVELMMAIALFTVAVLGIISMQKITVVSNAHAKNLAIAQRIAQTWATQLQMDSSSWVTTFDAQGVLQQPSEAWIRPAFVTGRIGGAFDGLGNPLSDTSGDLAQARFCTHVRTSWLYGDAVGVSGARVIRAEIRVFWLRDGQAPVSDAADGLCARHDAEDVKAIGEATGNYSFVYQTVGIRQHSQI